MEKMMRTTHYTFFMMGCLLACAAPKHVMAESQIFPPDGSCGPRSSITWDGHLGANNVECRGMPTQDGLVRSDAEGNLEKANAKDVTSLLDACANGKALTGYNRTTGEPQCVDLTPTKDTNHPSTLSIPNCESTQVLTSQKGKLICVAHHQKDDGGTGTNSLSDTGLPPNQWIACVYGGSELPSTNTYSAWSTNIVIMTTDARGRPFILTRSNTYDSIASNSYPSSKIHQETQAGDGFKIWEPYTDSYGLGPGLAEGIANAYTASLNAKGLTIAWYGKSYGYGVAEPLPNLTQYGVLDLDPSSYSPAHGTDQHWSRFCPWVSLKGNG